MSETDEHVFDDVDITGVPSAGDQDPADLTDEDELTAVGDDDDDVDIGESDDPTRPESGMVPAPPVDEEEN